MEQLKQLIYNNPSLMRYSKHLSNAASQVKGEVTKGFMSKVSDRLNDYSLRSNEKNEFILLNNNSEVVFDTAQIKITCENTQDLFIGLSIHHFQDIEKQRMFQRQHKDEIEKIYSTAMDKKDDLFGSLFAKQNEWFPAATFVLKRHFLSDYFSYVLLDKDKAEVAAALIADKILAYVDIVESNWLT